ncbi:hypothetical protein J6590_000711 [Homalodisca vitripennis]|nr:hypothetical protein J6590_000711 [Homalodisca vitripennis]
MPRRCDIKYIRCSLVDPASSHMLVSKIKPCKIPTRDGRDSFIRSKPIGAPAPHFLVTLNNFQLIARSSNWRRIFQMSDLSTVDGRCCAYHGCNG